MTIRKKLDRCNDINDFIVQNKDRHIFIDKNGIVKDGTGKGGKKRVQTIDNSQSIDCVKKNMRRIVKFEDLINKNNMTQILYTNIDKQINDTFKYEKTKFRKQ